jgi:hypothetical protein
MANIIYVFNECPLVNKIHSQNHVDHSLFDRSVHTGISCNDSVHSVTIDDIVHDDAIFVCNGHVMGPLLY